MVIHIGRGPKGWQKNLPPSNMGMAKIAQQRLDHVLAAYGRRHEEALTVDGVPLYIWLRADSGVRCSCGAADREDPDTIPTPRQEFEAAQRAADKSDGQAIRVRDIMRESDDGPGIEPENDPQKFRRSKAHWDAHDLKGKSAFEIAIAAHQKEKYAPDDPTDMVTDDMLDAVLSEIPSIVGDEEMSNSLTQSIAGLSEGGSLINGTGQTLCGICFGTGWTGGYSLQNGQRVVLDASGAQAVKTHDCEMCPTRPISFSVPCRSASFVEWHCALPNYFRDLHIRIRNNAQPASGIALIFSCDGKQSWDPLTTINMTNKSGSLSNVFIRAVTDQEAQNHGERGASVFTHVDLVFEFSVPIFGQMPQLALADNLDFYEPIVDTTFEISARAGGLTRGTLIAERKHGYIWKVSDVTNSISSRGLLSFTNVSARLIHAWEQLALLNLFKPLSFGIVPYRGLERIQGSTAGKKQV